LHRCVGALVSLQFERSVDKRIDIPSLHTHFSGIGHGGLDPGPYAVRQVVNCVLGLDFAIRDELTIIVAASSSSTNRLELLRAIVTDVHRTFVTTCDTNVNALPLVGSNLSTALSSL